LKVLAPHARAIIGVGFVVSLAACVWLTHFGDFGQPQWAFFMLPARAWELFAGAALALAGGRLLPPRPPDGRHPRLARVSARASWPCAIEFDATTPASPVHGRSCRCWPRCW
jgi:peptidoglycan/LPS O-acetylase OafA/YrhL